jgi:ATP-dependent DNA ligase
LTGRWPEVEEEVEVEEKQEKKETVVIEGEIIVLDP